MIQTDFVCIKSLSAACLHGTSASANAPTNCLQSCSHLAALKDTHDIMNLWPVLLPFDLKPILLGVDAATGFLSLASLCRASVHSWPCPGWTVKASALSQPRCSLQQSQPSGLSWLVESQVYYMLVCLLAIHYKDLHESLSRLPRTGSRQLAPLLCNMHQE